MYTIKVDYHTGDSFNSYDTSTTLGYEWNLEVAKENLRRIKAHYKAYSDRNNYYSMSMQEDGDKVIADITNEPWYCKGSYSDSWEMRINLLMNDGTSEQSSCSWVGYFERLNGATVLAIDNAENDMAFTL